jgi:hypothetical protein
MPASLDRICCTCVPFALVAGTVRVAGVYRIEETWTRQCNAMSMCCALLAMLANWKGM